MSFDADRYHRGKEPSIEERVEAVWIRFRDRGAFSDDDIPSLLGESEANLSTSSQLVEPDTPVSRSYVPAEYHQIILEAERKAREILEQARLDAEREVSELRRQAIAEIRSVVASIEELRTALIEETETQRLLSHVERLKSATLWLKGDDWAEEDSLMSADEGVPEGLPQPNLLL